MSRPLRVVLVEDDLNQAGLILCQLRQAGFEPTGECVEIELDLRAQLELAPDIILADVHQPKLGAMRALRLVQERGLDVPVIVVTSGLEAEVVVECLQNGACDYLLKDRLARVGSAVTRALDQKRVRIRQRQEVQALRTSETNTAEDVEMLLDGTITVAQLDLVESANPPAKRIFDYSSGLIELRTSPQSEQAGSDLRHELFTDVTDRGDDAPRVVVGHEKIFNRKLAEEHLRDRERMYAQSQRMAHVGSWELDLSSLSDLGQNILTWSDECCRIFGHEPGKVAVTTELFLKAVHADDREAIAAAMARALRNNSMYEIEHRVMRPDGVERVVQEWVEVVTESGGRPVRMVGTCQDVTEHKQAMRVTKHYAERLEALSRQLILAEEDGRRRIACELHDEVGQSLTATKIALDRLIRNPSDPEIGRRLADASAMIGQALDQVRDLTRLLRPPLLDKLGLPEALRALVKGLSERTGLGADVEIDEVGPVEHDVETACYRIAQEALTNSVKHAGATRLHVVLRPVGDDLELITEDDGIGFDVPGATARAARGFSLGMLSLHERANMVGGSTEIVSRPGRGTRVRTAVPARGRRAGHEALADEPSWE